jgi:chemotaxis protein histidine kinase CheA/CheY-like chemotaxis protein
LPPAQQDTAFTPLVDEELVEPFLEESADRLESLGQKLVALERAGSPSLTQELVNDVFRDLHTIKGSSAFVGLSPMNRLAHAAEDLVGQVRAGARPADRPVIDALLQAVDALRALLARASRRAPLDVDIERPLLALRDPGRASPPALLPAPGALTDGAQRGDAEAGALLPGVAAGGRTLRVDFDKLDSLLNLMGELVLAKSHLRADSEALLNLSRDLTAILRRARKGQTPLPPWLVTQGEHLHRTCEQLALRQTDDVTHLDRVAADLRDQIMRLRMVAIGRIFNKHHRTVRELGRALGKQVRLLVEGAETELDKVLVEQLDDPLLHLLRNAVDHGLEPPAERVAAGKPAEGLLRLHAEHLGGQIVISVGDDGRGVDPERVRARALLRGLASAEELAALPPARLQELIFRPGFSTAAAVSELSGRGVGLDVVAQAVSRLKGSIAVESTPGRGATFVLTLPLTLAIIQVLLIEVGDERYALPMEAVARALRVPQGAVQRIGESEVLLLDPSAEERLEVPLIDLGEVLGVAGWAPAAGAEGRHAILVEVGGAGYGLLCDRQVGKREIVIKGTGELVDQIPCVSSATLIDDRVVLVLDLPQVVQAARERPRQRRLAAAGLMPVPMPRPGPGPGEEDATDPPAPAPRILVAEDSAVEREALCRLLRARGYEVVAAPDGRAALALALDEAQRFDLLCTDVTMPHLDGYDLTRRLRRRGHNRDLPILMITARGEPADRVRGFDAGVDEYLLKPVDEGALHAAVAGLLRRYGRRS